MSGITAIARRVWDFTLHFLAATVGVAIAEQPFQSFRPPQTWEQLAVHEYILSAIVATLLGAFFYYHRRPVIAKWLGGIGIIGLFAHVIQGPAWIPLTRDEAARNAGWFVFTIAAMRLVFYSLGSLACQVWLGRSRVVETSTIASSENGVQ